MYKELNQGFIFGSEIQPPSQWRSYVTSTIVHVVIVIVLLLIPVAITREVEQVHTVTTLVAPPIKPYKPKIQLPRVKPPQIVAKVEIPPKPVIEFKPKPEVKPVPPPKPVITEVPKPVPQIAAAAPKPVPQIKAPEPAPAPVIKPQVKTGVFSQDDAAKNVQVAKQLKVGGFGDPNGAQTSPDTKTPQLLAKVGSFDMPQGEGASGGGGRQGRGTAKQTAFGEGNGGGSGPGGNGNGIGHGTVRQSGFGSPDGGGNGNGTGGNGRGGSVRTGGFGDSGVPVQTVQRLKTEAPATTPVEILSKPRPIYTQEARNLHLEGEVSLEVVFTAGGSVQVIRVVQGLGHGLDQAAQQAASQIRFRPGTRGGSPVDTRATIRITFELT